MRQAPRIRAVRHPPQPQPLPPLPLPNSQLRVMKAISVLKRSFIDDLNLRR